MSQNIDFDANPPVATNEYDNMAQMALPGYQAMHTMALSCLRSHLQKTANLLIVGAGTGMELVQFSKSNPEWQMLGVDPSSNMLVIAQEKIQQHGLSQRVKLFSGYTHDLPDTPVYDAATCILVMHFVPDDGTKLALLQSIVQRLKSAAALILVDVFGERNTPQFEQMASIVQEYWEAMGMPPERRQELREKVNSIYPIPELRVVELLEQAGFGSVMRFYTGLWVGGWVVTKD